MSDEELCKVIIELILNKKAQNIKLFNIQNTSILADYIIICSGNSTVQIQAITNSIIEMAKEKNIKIYGIEGKNEALWVLIDLGSIILHIMNPVVRQYYALEELWYKCDNIEVVDNTNLELFFGKKTA